MHTQEGMNKCDYCDGMEGYFEDASGNHVSCIEKEKAYAKIAELREALTQANELYNAVEAMNLELTERIAQDELAFGFMREANTLLTADVKRLTSELAQCKHALDDEVCECGRPLDEHEEDGLHPCTESGCLMFWLAEAK